MGGSSDHGGREERGSPRGEKGRPKKENGRRSTHPLEKRKPPVSPKNYNLGSGRAERKLGLPL